MKHLAIITVGLTTLIGCPMVTPVDGQVTGVVHKAPVSGATVSIAPLTEEGRGAVISSAQTSGGGAFSALSVGVESGPMLVCATGGTFADEATGLELTLGTNELCHVVDLEIGEVLSVVVDPWTTIASAAAECYVDRGSSPQDATSAAYGHVNAFLRDAHPDITAGTTLPFDPVGNLAPGLDAEVWAGLVNAALSQSAARISDVSGLERGVNVTPATLLAALVSDVRRDCVLDGMDGGTQVAVGTVPLNADALRGAPQGLLSSLADYLDRGRNSTGVTAQDVREASGRLAVHTSPLFGLIQAAPDFDPPAATFLSPAEGEVLSGVVTIEVAAQDAGAITRCVFDTPEQLAAVQPDVAPDRRTCSLVGDINTSELGDGPLTLVAEVVDEHGNRATASINVVVDNALPSVLISSPQAGSVVSGVITISADASDSAGVVSLEVLDPAGLTDILPAADQLEATWDTTVYPEGPFAIVVRAVDENGVEATAETEVTIDNLDVATISGTVEVGSPVVGSLVSAIAFDGLVSGDVLAEAETQADGSYQLLLAEAPSGPVLVTASGGSYADIATGSLFTLTAQLRGVVTGVTASSDSTAVINPWTTLAAVHAAATGTTDVAVQASYGALSSHLSRPAPAPISQIVGADLRAPAVASSPEAVVGLATGGLNRMAADLAAQQGAQPGTYSLSTILTALVSDLSDGVFNGLSGVDPVALVPGVAADSYVLRTRLTAAIHNFVENRELAGVEQPRNISGIVSTSLQVPDGLYDDLTLNDDTLLFPSTDVPLPFDDSPPALTVSFTGIHAAQLYGASLEGTVQVLAEASDDASSVQALRLISPLPEQFPDGLAVANAYRTSFSNEVLPNFYVVADACDFDPNLPPIDNTPSPAEQVCACFEAEDTIGNTTRAMHCFTRPAPVISFDETTPEDGTVVYGEFSARAAASSGFALQSVSIIGHDDVDGRPHVAQAIVPIDYLDDVNAPQIVLEAQAVDAIGRMATTAITLGREAAAADVWAPSKGEQTTVFSYPMYWGGALTSGYPFTSCEWRFERAGTEEVLLSGSMDTFGSACVIQDYVEEADLPDGQLRFVVEGTDVAGQSALAANLFTKNTVGVTASVLGPEDELKTNVAVGTFEFFGVLEPAVDATMTLHLERPSGTMTSFPVSLTNDDWILSISVATHLLEEGRYNYFLEVLAPSGAVTTTSSRSFTVDRTAPEVVVNTSSTKLDERPELGFTTVGSPTSGFFRLDPPLSYTPYTFGADTVFESWSTRTNWPRSTLELTSTDGATQSEDIEVLWRVVTGGCPSSPPAAAIPVATNYAGDRSMTFRQSNMPHIDLASEVADQDLRLCVWALDEAGNGADAPAYQQTFRWQSFAPPIYAEGGSSLYDESQNPADFGYWQHDDGPIYYNTASAEAFPSASVCPVSDWDCDYAVPRGYAVVDAVFVNPWDEPVDAKLTVAGTYSVRYTPRRHVLRGTAVTQWWNDELDDLRSPQADSSTLITPPSRPIWDRDCINKTTVGFPHELIGNTLGDTQDLECSVQPPEPTLTNRPDVQNGSAFQTIDYRDRVTVVEETAPGVIAYFVLAANGTIATEPNGTPTVLLPDAAGFVALPPNSRVVALVFLRSPTAAQTPFFDLGADLGLMQQAPCPVWQTSNLSPVDVDNIRYDKVLAPALNGNASPCRAFMFVQTSSNQRPDTGSLLCGLNSNGEIVLCIIDRTWWQADDVDLEQAQASMWPETRTSGGDVFSWSTTQTVTDGKIRKHTEYYQ